MDAVTQLQRQFRDYFSSLHMEGFVDDQFTELQKLQDESTPDFVAEVVTLFFEDCEKLINNMAKALEQQVVDYEQVDSHVHQLKATATDPCCWWIDSNDSLSTLMSYLYKDKARILKTHFEFLQVDLHGLILVKKRARKGNQGFAAATNGLARDKESSASVLSMHVSVGGILQLKPGRSFLNDVTINEVPKLPFQSSHDPTSPALSSMASNR